MASSNEVLTDKEVKLFASAYVAQVLEHAEGQTQKVIHDKIASITGLTPASAQVLLNNAKKHYKTLRENGIQRILDYNNAGTPKVSKTTSPSKKATLANSAPGTPKQDGDVDNDAANSTDADAGAPATPVKPTPKKRGRKPKAEKDVDTPTTPSGGEANSMAEDKSPVKPNTPKKRGRKPKAPADDTDNEEAGDANPPPAKKRKAPVKQAAKDDSSSETFLENPTEADLVGTETPLTWVPGQNFAASATPALMQMYGFGNAFGTPGTGHTTLPSPLVPQANASANTKNKQASSVEADDDTVVIDHSA